MTTKIIISDEEKALRKLVRNNGLNISNMTDPSETVKLLAVKQNGHAIKFIENPTMEMQLAAVHQNATSLEFIPEHTDELYFAALKSRNNAYYAAREFRNPSDAVLKQAFSQNSNTITFLQNPTVQNKIMALVCHAGSYPKVTAKTDAMRFEYIKEHPYSIDAVAKPTAEMCLWIIHNHPKYAREIRKPPTEEIKLLINLL